MSTTFVRETGEAITLDVTTRETVEYSANLSEHPIEDGANASDNSQRRNPSATFVGRFQRYVPGGDDPLSGLDSRIRQKILALADIVNTGELITVISPTVGTLENVQIARLPIESSNVNSVIVTVSVRQTEIAQRLTVAIPPLRPTEEAADGFTDEVDTGQQPTTKFESTDEATTASILYGLVDAFGFV